MLILIIVSLTILVGLGAAVAVEQADNRRSEEFNIRKQVHDRCSGGRSLPF